MTAKPCSTRSRFIDALPRRFAGSDMVICAVRPKPAKNSRLLRQFSFEPFAPGDIEPRAFKGGRAREAGVVELVDTRDLGSRDASREGSSPFTRTRATPRPRVCSGQDGNTPPRLRR